MWLLYKNSFRNILSVAGSDETLLIAEVDLPSASAVRNNKPYTGLRRRELYE